MLFEPEQAWLHEVSSEHEHENKTDIQCCMQLSGLDNFGFSRCSAEEHIFINYEVNTSYLIFLLILKCSAGKNCCVAIVVGSNNM